MSHVRRDPSNGLDTWPRRRPPAIVAHVDFKTKYAYVQDLRGRRLLRLDFPTIEELAKLIAK